VFGAFCHHVAGDLVLRELGCVEGRNIGLDVQSDQF